MASRPRALAHVVTVSAIAAALLALPPFPSRAGAHPAAAGLPIGQSQGPPHGQPGVPPAGWMTPPPPAATPSPDTLRALAIEALRLERTLLPEAGPDRLGTPAGDAAFRRLRSVDGDGERLLHQLMAAGLQPSVTLNRTLRRLPLPHTDGHPPAIQDYDAAIEELRAWSPRSPAGRGAGFPADLPSDLPPARTDGGPTMPAGPAPDRAGTPPPPPPFAGEPPAPRLRRDVAPPALWFTGSPILLLASAVVAGGFLALAAVGLARAFRRSRGEDALAIALTDALTGTANRARLDLDLRLLAEGPPTRISVVMIDVDHFKQVNDRHGHPSGDDVLRRVARVLKSQVRPEDVVYRYGGEEFCALLRNASYAESRRVADRLCAAVALAPMSIGEKVTVSIGVASGMSPQVELVLRRADTALYDAKRGGRNRVVADEGAFPQPQTAGR